MWRILPNKRRARNKSHDHPIFLVLRFTQGDDGYRYLSPAGVCEVSRRWCETLSVPVELSTTGAAASAAITPAVLDRHLPGWLRQQSIPRPDAAALVEVRPRR